MALEYDKLGSKEVWRWRNDDGHVESIVETGTRGQGDLVLMYQGRGKDYTLKPHTEAMLLGLGAVIVADSRLPRNEEYDLDIAGHCERILIARSMYDVDRVVTAYSVNKELFHRHRDRGGHGRR